MVIEIVWLFLHKILATIYMYLNLDDVLERAVTALQPSAAMF